ncbi:hypothetical protein DENSPDRAFT_840581 [Dentipellis sp. KUC8613]|nr:hypothetical protein DENSPDRAFT_840581 [Dentipellis sp. KUC8613]
MASLLPLALVDLWEMTVVCIYGVHRRSCRLGVVTIPVMIRAICLDNIPFRSSRPPGIHVSSQVNCVVKYQIRATLDNVASPDP